MCVAVVCEWRVGSLRHKVISLQSEKSLCVCEKSVGVCVWRLCVSGELVRFVTKSFRYRVRKVCACVESPFVCVCGGGGVGFV